MRAAVMRQKKLLVTDVEMPKPAAGEVLEQHELIGGYRRQAR